MIMTETNNILLNMMKHQLLVIYQTYQAMPQLLKDPAVNKGYKALLSTNNCYEFVQWQKLISDLGLSFANANGIERRQNVLGELDDLGAKANPATMIEFLAWKGTFDPCDWEFAHERNQKLVRKLQEMAEREYDVHILLINCGYKWVAVGSDADRLFEIFGWQTSAVDNGSEEVSYIYISDMGYRVLQESGYSIHSLYPAEDEGINGMFFSDSYTEDMVAAYQQNIDYLRLQHRKMNLKKEFMTDMASFVAPKLGYSAIVNSWLTITDDDVVAEFEDGSKVTIANGNCWWLDGIGLPYLMSLGSHLGEA